MLRYALGTAQCRVVDMDDSNMWAVAGGGQSVVAAPPPLAAGERRGRPYVSASLTARATATHR
jgi:hypothetical protein